MSINENPPNAAPSAQTNGTAIAALIFALLFAPVGIILGYIARGQIKRSGEGGRGFATAALIIGYIFTLTPLVVALVVVTIMLFKTAT
jgi:peptidyl-prolyl cis-trans isomerase B (cyclophilin B)